MAACYRWLRHRRKAGGCRRGAPFGQARGGRSSEFNLHDLSSAQAQRDQGTRPSLLGLKS